MKVSKCRLSLLVSSVCLALLCLWGMSGNVQAQELDGIAEDNTKLFLPLLSTAKTEPQLFSDPEQPVDDGPLPPIPFNKFVEAAAIPSEGGQWTTVFDWPFIPIHSIVAKDGTVVSFGGTRAGGQGGLSYIVWDPKKGTGLDSFTDYDNRTETDLFCAAQVTDPQTGNIFTFGGTESNGKQPNFLTVYDSTNQQLGQKAATMFEPRWYATATTLPAGDILVQGGVRTGGAYQEYKTTPEVLRLGGGFDLLTGATSQAAYGQFPTPAAEYGKPNTELRWWYPRSFVTPAGKVWGVSSKQMWYIDPTGNGSIDTYGAWPYENTGATSSSVMYRPGLVLQTGGGLHSSNTRGVPGSKRATIVNLNNEPPTFSSAGNMEKGRHWHNLTVLPDGNVLATGGSSENNTLSGVANEAELWNPSTNRWRTLNAGALARLYHSVAILLPDGSIMTGGGGAPGPLKNNNAEVFYPPYLFTSSGARAPRPVWASMPSSVGYGGTFRADVTSGSDVARVTFVKTGGVTHSFNMDQRFMELNFSRTGNTLTIDGPPNANIATPGNYYVFAVSSSGVPSEAKIVTVYPANNPSQPTGGVTDSMPALEIPFGPSGPSDVVAEGTYLLKSERSGKCADVSGSKQANGDTLMQYTCNPNAAQHLWSLESQPDGSYFIRNKLSQKCMDINGSKQNNGDKIIQYTCNPSATQHLWKLQRQPNGNYFIRNKLSEKCIDIDGTKQNNGDSLMQYTCNPDASQHRWELIPQGGTGGTGDPGNPDDPSSDIAEGTYLLKSERSGKCADVSGSKQANGDTLMQYTCNPNAAQHLWSLESQPDGSYFIRNKLSQKCMDINGSKQNNGDKVIQYTCNPNAAQHLWSFEMQPSGNYLIRNKLSEKCIDIDGTKQNNGDSLMQYTCNPNASQHRWELIPQSGTGDPGNPGNPDAPNRYDFDFGTSSSPVQNGWTQVTPTTNSSVVKWSGANRNSVDRGQIAGNAINRDLVYGGGNSTLNLSIGNGTWRIIMNMSDHCCYRGGIGVIAEGETINSNISINAGATVYVGRGVATATPRSFDVTVTDGVLNLDFSKGESAWVINRLSLVRQ